MKSSEAKLGRVFVIRLEDGDILHESIERFAVAHGIRAASLVAVGGADAGSRLVVGPRDGRAAAIEPMEHVLDNVAEVTGTGTLFPDESGHPILHMHLACGREDRTVTGCVRRGVKVWQVLEVVLAELTDCPAARRHDPVTGFALLQPGG
jgi:predicted DNA-binding protein with PD1-like motif